MPLMHMGGVVPVYQAVYKGAVVLIGPSIAFHKKACCKGFTFQIIKDPNSGLYACFDNIRVALIHCIILHVP